MLESGVKIEGSEVIPPSPDSVGKQKSVNSFCQYLFTYLGCKSCEKKIEFECYWIIDSSAIEPSIGTGI